MVEKLCIKGEPIIEVFSTCDGKHLFVTERSRKNGKVFLSGYVKVSSVLDWVRFCDLPESNLKVSDGKVWKISKKNWWSLPELKKQENKREIEDQKGQGGRALPLVLFKVGCKQNDISSELQDAFSDDGSLYTHLSKAWLNRGNVSRRSSNSIGTISLPSLVLKNRHNGYLSAQKNTSWYRQHKQQRPFYSGVRDYKIKLLMLRKPYLPARRKLARSYRGPYYKGVKLRYSDSWADRMAKAHGKYKGVNSYGLDRGLYRSLYRSLESYVNSL